FDFDGTLADGLKAMVKCFNLVAKKYAYPTIKTPQIAALKELGAKAVFKELKIPLLKLAKIIAETKKEFKKEIPRLQLIKPWGKTLNSLKKQGCRLGILSSNNQDNIQLFLKNRHLDQFDFVTCESDIFGKDRALVKLLKKLGLKKEEVLYVGDEIRDIEACQKAGIRIVAVDWGFNSRPALQSSHPDYLISQPQDLLKILTS
ncbi:MAG: HAD-IA family hydrolase, partial [Candidatus Shapirobacteria bacterium]